MVTTKRKMQRLLLSLLGLTAMFTLGFAPDPGPLVFQDDRPLHATWEQAVDGLDVVVCNVSANPVTSVQSALTGFHFSADGGSVVDDKVLDQPALIDVLPAGQCSSISVRAVDEASNLDPATYSGLLVVFSPDTGVIRREVHLTVSSETPEPTPPANPSEKLVFKGLSALTLTYAQAINGVDVEVCNDGNKSATSLKVEWTGFRFLKENSLLAIEDVFVPFNIASALEAGTCTIIRVQMDSSMQPDPGDYDGTLLISTVKDDKTTERTTLPIKVSFASLKTTTDKIVLTATRNGPFGRKAQLDEELLYLQPVSDQDVAPIPAGPDRLIGTLNFEGSPGYLYSQEVKPEQAQSNVVPIRAAGLEEVGTYTGTVNLTGIGSSGTAIPVEIKVTDNIGWAIGAIIVGLLLSIVSTLATQRWRYELQILPRRNRIETLYASALQIFKIKAGQRRFHGYTLDQESITNHLAMFDESFSTYKKSNPFLFEPSADDFKKLIKTLESAEMDAKLLGEESTINPGLQKSLLCESLGGLDDKLSDLKTFIQEAHQLSQAQRPNFVQFASKLLAGDNKTIKACQVAKIREKADEYAEMVDLWKRMAEKIWTYREWGRELLMKEYELASNGIPMRSADSELLRQALSKVEEASNELMVVTDLAELKELGAIEDLKLAYNHLAYLRGRYGRPTSVDFEIEMTDQLYLIRPATGAARVAPSLEDAEWFRPGTVALPIQPDQVAALQEAVRLLSDVFIFGLGVVIAIAIALPTLYFGKTFGTFENYLAAIMVGLTTPAVLKFITDTLKQFGSPLKS